MKTPFHEMLVVDIKSIEEKHRQDLQLEVSLNNEECERVLGRAKAAQDIAESKLKEVKNAYQQTKLALEQSKEKITRIDLNCTQQQQVTDVRCQPPQWDCRRMQNWKKI